MHRELVQDIVELRHKVSDLRARVKNIAVSHEYAVRRLTYVVVRANKLLRREGAHMRSLAATALHAASQSIVGFLTTPVAKAENAVLFLDNYSPHHYDRAKMHMRESNVLPQYFVGGSTFGAQPCDDGCVNGVIKTDLRAESGREACDEINEWLAENGIEINPDHTLRDLDELLKGKELVLSKSTRGRVICFVYRSMSKFTSSAKRRRSIYAAWRHTGLAKCLERGRYINIIEHTKSKTAVKGKKRKRTRAMKDAEDFYSEVGGFLVEQTDKSGAVV